VNSPDFKRPHLLEWFGLGLVIAALSATMLPWLNNQSAALSANLPDLAEWVGLSPAQRAGSPPMLAPFLLRWVLLSGALLLSLRARVLRGTWGAVGAGGAALLTALSLLPPIDYFREAGGDINYQQLMGLCAGALVGIGAVWALRRVWLPWRLFEGLITLSAVCAALSGLILSLNEINRLGIPAPVGVGAIITILSLIAHSVGALLPRG